jgi:tetratricopeptide (TPR) repeat protein
VAAAALVVAGVMGVRVLVRRLAAPAPQAAVPRAGDEAVAAWRSSGQLPPAGGGEKPSPEAVAERVATGRAALAADRPGGAKEAIRAFRAALALAPDSADAAAGYAIALAEEGVDGLEGAELARAHALVREALQREQAHPRLLAGYARLLLAVHSARNLAEAREVAARAQRVAPGDADVALAAGMALTRSHPAAGAHELAAAAARTPGDRRLLSAAGRATWQAGDAGGALALARARLALDADHPGALALTAEILTATDRPEEARATLARWAQARPDAAEPLLLEARLRYQLDRDLPAARRLLAAALARGPDDFLAARILAHRAAVERDAGDAAAARTAVADGLARVPASAPVQFQAALLAFDARDDGAFREAAGTVGDRAGPLAAARLAARALELSGDGGEALAAYQALAERVSSDPEGLLEVAGGLARLRAPGPALDVAKRALRRDLADARLGRAPTDFWEGPSALAAAAQAFREMARAEGRASGTALSAAAAGELLLGHARDADAAARAAEAVEPQAAAPRWLQAQVALDLGQPARALPLARAAVEAAESDPAALATLGRALEASTRLDDAVRSYRKALAGAPDLVSARLALARIQARKGDAAGGRNLLLGLQRDAAEAPAVRRALLDLGAMNPAVP